jgi:putative hydrolase of the HAD superfamily
MPNSPVIHTVIFDLGGVYFTEGVKQFVAKMADRFSISEQAVRAMVDGEAGTKYRTGDMTPAEFWASAMQYWTLTVPTDEVTQMWLSGYVPIEGTVRIVDTLKSDYELLFLSDNAPDRISYLESRYHFIGKFKAGVFSHMLGVRKPDPKMYKEALRLASHPAEECVYIDDRPHLLEPAKALGMKTIAFQNPEQLQKELEMLDIKI